MYETNRISRAPLSYQVSSVGEGSINPAGPLVIGTGAGVPPDRALDEHCENMYISVELNPVVVEMGIYSSNPSTATSRMATFETP
jgi:hypothetical protein